MDSANATATTAVISKKEARRRQMEKIILGASSSKVDHSALVTRSPNDADCSFTLTHGKNTYTVPGHRFVLEICCPNLFLVAVKRKLTKKGVINIEVDEKKLSVPQNTFLALLKFFYSGNVNFFKIEVFGVMDLLIAAKTYEVKNLVKLCQHWLLCVLEGNTWFYTFKESRRLKLKEFDVVCKIFARNNFEEILAEKQGIVALGVDLFHEIVSFVCLPQDKSESELTPLDDVVASIRSVFQSDFERIYEEMMRSDVCFGFKSILCHLGIVTTQCSELGKQLNDVDNLINIPNKYNFNEETTRILLHFLYTGQDCKIHPFNALQLHAFGADFGLSKLCSICDHQLTHGINASTVFDLLAIGKKLSANKTRKDLTQIQEVQVKCYQFVLTNFKQLNFKEMLAHFGESQPPLTSIREILVELLYIIRANAGNKLVAGRSGQTALPKKSIKPRDTSFLGSTTNSSASASPTPSKRPRVPRPLSNSHHHHHDHHHRKNMSASSGVGSSRGSMGPLTKASLSLSAPTIPSPSESSTGSNTPEPQPSPTALRSSINAKMNEREKSSASGATTPKATPPTSPPMSPKSATSPHKALSTSSPRTEMESKQPAQVAPTEVRPPTALSEANSNASSSTTINKSATIPAPREQADDSEISLVSSVTIKCLDDEEPQPVADQSAPTGEAELASPAITVTASHTPPLTLSSRKNRKTSVPSAEMVDSSNNLDVTAPPPNSAASGRERRHTDNEVSFVEKLRQQAEKEAGKTHHQQKHLKFHASTAISSSAGSSANSGSSTGDHKVERRKSVKIESLIAQISTSSNRISNEKKSEVSPEEMIKSENTRKLRHLFESESTGSKDLGNNSGRKIRSSSVV